MNNTIDISLLKPHPKNEEIYGDEDIKELAIKIEKSNWIKPILINQENVIISGHRRYYSCLSLNIKEVPYEIAVFENSNEELERLLLENMYREKTVEQKVKEAEIWEVIEKEKSGKRKLANLKQNTEGENFPVRKNGNHSENFSQTTVKEKSPVQSGKGRTLDIVAKKVGIGSGKTYEKAKVVVKEIDKLKEQGKETDSEFLKTVLNSSVGGAKNIIDLNCLNKISEEVKNKVIDGKISVKKTIQKIKNDLADINNNTNVENNIVFEFQSNINTFIKSIEKFIDMEELFEDMAKENKDIIMSCIENIENSMNQIKNNIY